MERSGVNLNRFKVEYRDEDMNGSRFVDITQIGNAPRASGCDGARQPSIGASTPTNTGAMRARSAP